MQWWQIPLVAFEPARAFDTLVFGGGVNKQKHVYVFAFCLESDRPRFSRPLGTLAHLVRTGSTCVHRARSGGVWKCPTVCTEQGRAAYGSVQLRAPSKVGRLPLRHQRILSWWQGYFPVAQRSGATTQQWIEPVSVSDEWHGSSECYNVLTKWL